MARPRGSKKQRELQQRLAMGAGKMIGYARVSTEGQGENGHSLAGQQDRLRETAERAGFEVIDVVAEVGSGTKDRDGLKAVQARIDAGEAEGIVFAKLDRLGRGLVGLGRLLRWATEKGVTLLSVTEGMVAQGGEVVNEAAEVLVGLAAWQARYISKRTKEGLAAARAKGVRLGRPAVNSETAGARAAELRRSGLTIAKVTEALNAEGFQTARGNPFAVSTVYETIRRIDPEALAG